MCGKTMKIPAGWLNYSSHGQELIDKFIAFKVPLAMNKICVPPDERFTPAHVIKNIPIGLIIDLTNTSRYYDPCEFVSQGIKHVKLAVQGQVVPHKRLVKRFNDIANEYFNDSANNGKLIGVHCTHGLNRTGYLICAYLIQMLAYNPEEAINLFNVKRGHKMERKNYLESLLSMVPGVQVEPRRASNSSAPNRAQAGQVNGIPNRAGWRQDRSSERRDTAPRAYGRDSRQQDDTAPRAYGRNWRQQDDTAPRAYSRDSRQQDGTAPRAYGRNWRQQDDTAPRAY
uniref:Uncharacterized protein n=1 Tax=Anopheles minimus TaxID=112268 RepID=A0A182WDJ0_9DIPT